MRLLILGLLISPIICARCQRSVERDGYSVCVPKGFRIDFEKSPESARIMLCKPDAEGRCVRNKDIYPYPGVLTIDISPADGLYRNDWTTPEKMISRAQDLGEPIPQVSDGALKEEAQSERSCWVARVLKFGDLWQETYGLTVKNRRFIIRVSYNNEPENIGAFPI